MVHQDFPASAFCELILKCRSNKIPANVTHTPQKYFQCHRKSEPFGTGRSQGFCWLCHSSGVIGIHKYENKVGVKHRTQDMSDSISTFSELLELLLKCCRESLEKSIQNFRQVLLLPKQPISLPSAFPFLMEHTEEGAGIPRPGSHCTNVTVPFLLWETPRYNQEYGIIQQGKTSPLAMLLLLWEKWCFFNSVRSNWINWFTRQHFATSREIFLLNLLLFGQNWKSPFWHKTELFEP